MSDSDVDKILTVAKTLDRDELREVLINVSIELAERSLEEGGS